MHITIPPSVIAFSLVKRMFLIATILLEIVRVDDFFKKREREREKNCGDKRMLVDREMRPATIVASNLINGARKNI